MPQAQAQALDVAFARLERDVRRVLAARPAPDVAHALARRGRARRRAVAGARAAGLAALGVAIVVGVRRNRSPVRLRGWGRGARGGLSATRTGIGRASRAG